MSRKFLVPIVLPADPAAAMEAATKQYVDGMNEVFIGPNDPGMTYEIWVDSDASGSTAPGVGIPSGGTAGQVLAKNSATNYDASWVSLGIVARPALITADQSGITNAVTDLSGFTNTFTVVAGRLYEVSWSFSGLQNTAAGNHIFYISLDGAQHIVIYANVQANIVATYAGSFYFTGGNQIAGLPFVAAGSRVIKLRGTTSAGTLTIGNSSINNGRFWIKDIGAAI